MLDIAGNRFWTRRELLDHLANLGVRAGDDLMVHAGMRSVGPLIDGPNTLIGALLDAIGPSGTLLCYTNWDQQYEDALDEDGRLDPALKPDIPPFDPCLSRASRDHGIIAEFIRTWPGALRSGNPGASVAAIGVHAEWYTREHPLDYGYGEGSPFARLVEAGGKVLMVGAPLDTLSLLHHAEHLADIPGKRIVRMEVPLLIDGRTEWRLLEEFDTCDPVIDGLPDDYFGDVVRTFLDAGQGSQGRIGNAESVLVSARPMRDFAIRWLEEHCSDGR
ncbi:aminoglycoside 3-N-acetyltransferase [Pseudomonas sp. PIC25]|uniref:aminoglycoside 3-N-acetyltransferase n=1 Tax=Pseudomonas sp. PIC25 TaxID=1958773 RepID=UPI000BAB9540|nr:aminoglycoside 3-N-acetyltransferase [Pseudomonas sp. PIC25]